MVVANLRKNINLQCQNRAMTNVFRKTNSVGNMHVFVPCQIDVVNKQLVSPHSWNNLISETLLGESYVLMIYRHPDVKEKHSLDVEGVYNM